MLRSTLASIVVFAACGVDDPAAKSDQAADRVCTSTLSVTGSFASAVTPPANVGCWPVGMWTLAATIDQNACSPAPQMLPSYAFRGALLNGTTVASFSYVTDPASHAVIRMSATCEGELDVYSSDGLQVWTLKPSLAADGTLSGDGEYALYTTDQWAI